MNFSIFISGFFFLILSTINPLFAQNKNISTLEKAVKKTRGKAKVDALNELTIWYLSHGRENTTRYFNHQTIYRRKGSIEPNLPEAKAAIERSIKIAKRRKYNDGLAVAYFLEGTYFEQKKDLVEAEKSLFKWLNVRKKQGEENKIRWAYEGLSTFYYRTRRRIKSYEIMDEMYDLVGVDFENKERKRDFLKHKYLKAYRKYKDTSYDAQNLEQVAIDLGNFTNHLLQNIELSTFNNPFLSFDNFFEYEIIQQLKNHQPQIAYDIGEKWITTRATFSDANKDARLYLISRKIAKYFFVKNKKYDTEIIHFINKSVEYAKNDATQKELQTAYFNACYYHLQLKKHREVLALMIEAKPFMTDFFRYKAALNTCLTAILDTDDEELKEEMVQVLKNWQSTLKDKRLYNWCSDYIVLLGK